MSRPSHNLAGQAFGRLMAIERLPGGGKARWRCKCECGNAHTVQARLLQKGEVRSCGCLGQTKNGPVPTHGDAQRGAKTKEFRAWAAFRDRCRNPKNKAFHHYGGRGITVCERWADCFEAFLADMGRAPSPKHSIDRIDNDKGYEPGNCRWATDAQQANNRRNTVRYNGVPLKTLCDEVGFSYDAALKRLRRHGNPFAPVPRARAALGVAR